MKKSLFLLLFPALVGFWGWGCDKEIIIDDSAFSRNYVQLYQKIDSFTGFYHGAYRAIQLTVKGDGITQHSPEYAEIANSFHDTFYNRGLPPFVNRVILTEVDAIDAVSDTDFSAELTAGKSLGHVVKLYGLSPHNYIRSGYTDVFDWEKDQPEEFKPGNWGVYYPPDGLRGGGSLYPVIKFLSEATANDMMLLDPHYFYLKFTEIPAVKQHKITVTLRIEGQELSTVVDVDFNDRES